MLELKSERGSEGSGGGVHRREMDQEAVAEF